MSDMNSIDLDRLLTALETSRTQIGAGGSGLQGELASFTTLYNAVLSRCNVQVADQVCIERFSALLTQWADTDTEGQLVYDDLIQDHSGVTSFDGGPLMERLQARGTQRAAIGAEPGELLGMPPTSGYADDPVCTANGNFVHQETDIGFIGFGQLIDVQRTYNAMAVATPGVFGLGWSSALDMAVTASGAELVRVRLADGAEVPFSLDPETDLSTRDHRRGLTMERLPGRNGSSGWRLSSDDDEVWLFDSEGRLTGGSKGYASFTVERSADHIAVGERLSGRSVRYALNDGGLVQTVSSSDGRSSSFEYDDDSCCVRADRPAGPMVYEIDDGRIVSMTDADGVVLFRNRYDEEGRVASQTNEHGRVSNYEYIGNGMTRLTYGDDGPSNLYAHDDHGNLTALYGGDGGAMRMWWDERNRLTRLVERGGIETRYEFAVESASGGRDLLLRRIDPDGLEESYEYDDVGRIVARTGRDGVTRHHVYEGANTVPSAIIEADGTETIATYDRHELLLTVTDADGIETELLWDRDGQLIGTVTAMGDRSTIAYDRVGRLSRIVDPMGHEQAFHYDDGGRLVSATSPSGATATYAYSPAGRAVSCSADGRGSWSVTYDRAGLVETFTDAGGATTDFSYDDFGWLVSRTDPTGATYRREVDALGRQLAIVDPLGARTTFEYTRNGRMSAVIDPDGNRLEAVVDAIGRTTSVTTAAGLTSTWTYHPLGDIASHTDPAGQTVRHEFNERGRLAVESGPDGGATRYSYSPGGRLTAAVTAVGRRHDYTTDAAGRIEAVTDSDGNIVAATHRPDGQVSTLTAPDGKTTTFAYDDAGRVNGISVSEVGQGPILAFGRRALELNRAVGDPTLFEFDARGLLESVSDPAGLVTDFSFDPRRRLAATTTGTSRRSYTYDAGGNLQTATDPLGVVTSYRRSSVGHLEAVSIGDRLLLTCWHDADGRLTGIDDAHDRALVAYGYDERGLMTEAANEEGSVQLQRDAAGRVVGSVGLGGQVTLYHRDEDGLVTERTDGHGVATTYVRSSAGKLTGFIDPAVGDVPLPDDPQGRTRDPEGRVTTDELGRVYQYDAAGRLVEATGADGNRRAFTYNDDGLLATDQTPEFGRRTFTYDLAGAVARIDVADGTSSRFSYDEVGRRTSEVRSDGSTVTYGWNDLDHLVRVARTGADGTATTTEIAYSGLGRVERVDGMVIGWDDGGCAKPITVGADRYLRSCDLVRRCEPGAEWSNGMFDDPFGLSTANDERVTLSYRGELTVDGLVFMGARVYDPGTRSFLSRDPLPSVPGQVAFGGLYTYAHNDPINYLDPTGCRPLSDEEFQEVRADLEQTAFGAFGDYVWEHRDVIKNVAVGAVAIAGAAAFCGATAGVGCVVIAGAVVGAGSMVALDVTDAAISGEEYGLSDAGWSALRGGVIGGASAGAGMIGARANPLTTKPTVGALTNLRVLLANSAPRTPLAQAMARAAIVDFGLTAGGNTLLDLLQFGEPQWTDSSFVDWVS